MMARIRAIAVMLAVALVLAACGGGTGNGDGGDEITEIKLGFVGSLTGPFAPSGKNSLDGLTAGVEYLREKYPDIQITIESRDTAGEASSAVALTRELAQAGVSAIYYTTEAFPAVQDVLNQLEIPGDTAGGISSVLDKVGDSNLYKYAFSTGPGTAGPDSIRPLIDYAKQYGNNLAVLADSTAYGAAQLAQTKDILSEEYPDINLIEGTFPAEATDVTAQLSQLRDAGADALLVWSYGAPLVAVMSSLEKLGWAPPMSAVLGIGDPASAALIPEAMKDRLAAGPMPRTFLSDAPGAEPSGITKEFVDRYMAIKGRDDFNALDTVGAIPFDWTIIVLEAALEAGSTNPKEIKEVIVSGEEFQGANGIYKFGPDKRISIDGDQLALFLPSQPCTQGMCVMAGGN